MRPSVDVNCWPTRWAIDNPAAHNVAARLSVANGLAFVPGARIVSVRRHKGIRPSSARWFRRLIQPATGALQGLTF